MKQIEIMKDSHVKIVINLNHGRVHTGAQTLDLAQCEQIILGGLAHVYAQLFLDGLEYAIAVTKPTRCRGAYLNMIFAYRVAYEHGVEGGHFVHAHIRHLEDFGDLVHGRKREPTFFFGL